MQANGLKIDSRILICYFMPMVREKIYFLEEDYNLLQSKILQTRGRISEALNQVGVAVSGGGETYHDNFAFDEAHRAHDMWAYRTADLIRLKNQATIVEPDYLDDYVGFGHCVTFRDLDSGVLASKRIGSYAVFSEDTLSYRTPMAKVLLGANRGEIRERQLGDQTIRIEILDIQNTNPKTAIELK